LVGETISNPFSEESKKRTKRHIGNYVLDTLKSDPNFIGQVKYFKNLLTLNTKIVLHDFEERTILLKDIKF